MKWNGALSNLTSVWETAAGNTLYKRFGAVIICIIAGIDNTSWYNTLL